MDAYYFQHKVHFIWLKIIQNLETVKKLNGENQLYNMICICNFTMPIAFPSSLIPATPFNTQNYNINNDINLRRSFKFKVVVVN